MIIEINNKKSRIFSINGIKFYYPFNRHGFIQIIRQTFPLFQLREPEEYDSFEFSLDYKNGEKLAYIFIYDGIKNSKYGHYAKDKKGIGFANRDAISIDFWEFPLTMKDLKEILDKVEKYIKS